VRPFLIPIKKESEMETLVLIDELVCEHISLKEIEKELNKEMKFCSSRVLIEYMNNLIG